MVNKGSEPVCENAKLDNRPCFFKIYLDGLTTEHVRVPPQFRKHILEDLPHVRHPDRAVLRGSSGEVWRIKLTRVAHEIYLEDGWQQFASHHSLGNKEFLMFTYDGNLHFDVEIFDGHGTERLCGPDDQNDQALHSKFRQPRELKRSKKKDHSEGKVKVKEINLQCDETKGKKRVDTGAIKSKKEGKKVLLSETSSPSRCGSSKKNVDWEEEAAMNLKANEAFNSKFPYFEKCLKKYNVQEKPQRYLRIPIYFARKYLFQTRTKMILRNQRGKTWEVIYQTSGASFTFGDGWASFVHDNKLKENDSNLSLWVRRR